MTEREALIAILKLTAERQREALDPFDTLEWLATQLRRITDLAETVLEDTHP